MIFLFLYLPCHLGEVIALNLGSFFILKITNFPPTLEPRHPLLEELNLSEIIGKNQQFGSYLGFAD
jgi:hypothetical protein